MRETWPLEKGERVNSILFPCKLPTLDISSPRGAQGTLRLSSKQTDKGNDYC